MAIKYLIGIDEAGRGPLAGPVAVGAVIMPLDTSCPIMFAGLEVRDSKKLSARQRGMVFSRMRELKKITQLDFAVALVNNEVIDSEGITAAIRQGISNCLQTLIKNARTSDAGLGGFDPLRCRVLLDGGLRAPAEFPHQQTIIRGDESEAIISLASIAAKVTRDNFMIELHQRYPQYHFDQHKGYGTAVHYLALAKHGLSVIHRRSFLRSLGGNPDTE